MYSAPAVSYPVGRSHLYGQLLVGALLLGFGSLAAWIMQADTHSFRHLAAVTLWVVSAAAAIVAWWRSPHGLLTWDGQNWTWTCGETSRQVVLSMTLDSQSSLLLRWREAGASEGWVWLERRTAPTRWMPLRRAVFAPQVANAARDACVVLP